MALKAQSANRKYIRTAQGVVEFQHRHFAFVAAAIKEMCEDQPPQMLVAHSKFWADKLAGTNSRFDRARFLAACGTEG